MSDENLDHTALPCDQLSLAAHELGLTKLEWASVQIAAAFIASGRSAEEAEVAAIKLAAAVLRSSAP